MSEPPDTRAEAFLELVVEAIAAGFPLDDATDLLTLLAALELWQTSPDAHRVLNVHETHQDAPGATNDVRVESDIDSRARVAPGAKSGRRGQKSA